MKLLLDTHVFLWYISGDARLPAAFRDALRDSANGVFLSPASLWECQIKFDLGKLQMPCSAAEFIPPRRAAHGIASLSIYEDTIIALAELPALHRDPFDRLILAQSIRHAMTIITVDRAMLAYSMARFLSA